MEASMGSDASVNLLRWHDVFMVMAVILQQWM